MILGFCKRCKKGSKRDRFGEANAFGDGPGDVENGKASKFEKEQKEEEQLKKLEKKKQAREKRIQ